MLRRDFIGTGALALAGQMAGVSAPVAAGKSCIRVMMVGGPSQLDTFDPKPDAPSDIRGPFRAIRTTVPDIRISELFPRLARQARKFSLLRSMHYPGELLHEEGLRLAQGGSDAGVILPASLPFADNCLKARQLIESGTGLVTIHMFDTAFAASGWDMHGYSPFSSFATYRDSVAAIFDMAMSRLIGELDERGLLETTLVVTLSEFGRTPKINPTGGRDHWTRCWTTLLAGGGIEGGQILGGSDKNATEPRDNPTTPAMLLDLISRTLTSRTQT